MDIINLSTGLVSSRGALLHESRKENGGREAE